MVMEKWRLIKLKENTLVNPTRPTRNFDPNSIFLLSMYVLMFKKGNKKEKKVHFKSCSYCSFISVNGLVTSKQVTQNKNVNDWLC